MTAQWQRLSRVMTAVIRTSPRAMSDPGYRGYVSATTSRIRLSKPEPLKVARFAFKILETVRLEYLIGLQKSVQRVTGSKAKQAPQLRLGQVAAPVFFERQRLKGASRKIAAGRRQTLSDVVGNIDDYVHVPTLAAEARQDQD
jgi:hypothetical protein